MFSRFQKCKKACCWIIPIKLTGKRSIGFTKQALSITYISNDTFHEGAAASYMAWRVFGDVDRSYDRPLCLFVVMKVRISLHCPWKFPTKVRPLFRLTLHGVLKLFSVTSALPSPCYSMWIFLQQTTWLCGGIMVIRSSFVWRELSSSAFTKQHILDLQARQTRVHKVNITLLLQTTRWSS